MIIFIDSKRGRPARRKLREHKTSLNIHAHNFKLQTQRHRSRLRTPSRVRLGSKLNFLIIIFAFFLDGRSALQAFRRDCCPKKKVSRTLCNRHSLVFRQTSMGFSHRLAPILLSSECNHEPLIYSWHLWRTSIDVFILPPDESVLYFCMHVYDRATLNIESYRKTTRGKKKEHTARHDTPGFTSL